MPAPPAPAPGAGAEGRQSRGGMALRRMFMLLFMLMQSNVAGLMLHTHGDGRSLDGLGLLDSGIDEFSLVQISQFLEMTRRLAADVEQTSWAVDDGERKLGEGPGAGNSSEARVGWECEQDNDCCDVVKGCELHCRLGQNITDKSHIEGWRVGGRCTVKWQNFCLEDEDCGKLHYCKRGWLTREGTCTFDELCTQMSCEHGYCLAGKCTCHWGFRGSFCERSTNAFAFLLYGGSVSYLVQARVLVHSLRAQGAREDIVAIVPKSLAASTPPNFLQLLQQDGVLIHHPEDVPMPPAMDLDPVIHERWKGVMNKFTVWLMTNYSWVALLDPDIVVDMPSENPGNLFYACKSPLCAVQDNDRSTLNAGVMVVSPSTDRFYHIMDALQRERHHYDMPEQTFLTRYANDPGNSMQLMYLDTKWNSCVGGGMLFNTGLATSGYNLLHSCSWGAKPPHVRLCSTDPTCDPNKERHTVLVFQHHHLRVDGCGHRLEPSCEAEAGANGATCVWCGHYCSDARVPCSPDLFLQSSLAGTDVLSLFTSGEALNATEDSIEACEKRERNKLFKNSTWLDLPAGWYAWPQAALYQLLTDRFASDTREPCHDLTDYCGGSFHALTDKLQYLKELGVDGIAISPVVQNWPKGYHGYWPRDLDTTNEHFGSPEDLLKMVDRAHENGIKVVVDVVLNHAGYPDMPIKDIEKLRPFNLSEQYHSENCSMWYDTDFDRGRKYLETCRLFGMPDYKHEDAAVWQGLLAWLRRHVEAFGFDAVRVDAAKHIPTSFLRQATAPDGGPPVPTFYEVVTGDLKVVTEASNTGDYSVVYNYPLYHVLRDCFVPSASRLPMTALAQRISSMKEELGGLLSLNFLDNNDQPRFVRLVNGDRALYHNALLALLGMEGVPVLLYGSEQDQMGRAPPNPEDNYHMMHDGWRVPQWETGYDAEWPTFKKLKKVLWLRTKYQGLHSFPAEVFFADHQWLAFARGPLLFVLTNVGGDHHSYQQRVLWPNATVFGCRHSRMCDVFLGGCIDIIPGKAIQVELFNGAPRLFVPMDLLEEPTKHEQEEQGLKRQDSPQVPAPLGIRLLQIHEWDKIEPLPIVEQGLEMAARSPQAVLQPGVEMHNPPEWGPSRPPHLDTWSPPIGEPQKSASRMIVPNACIFNDIRQQLLLVYAPRPNGTFVMVRNDGEAGWVAPRVEANEVFKAAATLHDEQRNYISKPVFHLAFGLLYAGTYHVLIEALPSIAHYLPQVRNGSMQVFAHAGVKVLRPVLEMLGILEQTIFAPEGDLEAKPLDLCTRALHMHVRSMGFSHTVGLHALRRELQLPDGPLLDEKAPAEKTRRRDAILVLSRGNSTRCLRNEDDLLRGLESLGRPVEVVLPSPETLPALVRAMSRAEVVVGAHGANMANLLFAPPRTKVVEILPQVPFKLVNHHFRVLAGALGFPYSAFGQRVADFDSALAEVPLTQSKAIQSYDADVGGVTAAVAKLLAEQ